MPVKVLMITQDMPVTRRIIQEAQSLVAAGYEVRILTRSAGTADSVGNVEGIPVEQVAVRGQDPRFRWLYPLVGLNHGSQAAALWSVLMERHTFTIRALPRAVAARADIYHAHDLNNLYIAQQAAQAHSAKLVYDAHELFPEIANRWIRLKRQAWIRLEQRLLPATDLVITVNEFIAAEMARRYQCPTPIVLLNCPNPPQHFDLASHYNLLRDRLNLGSDCKIVLYQGWMEAGRGLENLIQAAPQLNGNTVIVLLGYGEYQHHLERLAARTAPGRVHFLPAVPQQDLLAYCASADVGIIPYQAVDLNNYFTSPNKLFDFIQAGVPIVANDLPFLRQVIVSNGLGIVTILNNTSDYARAINQIITQPEQATAMRMRLRAIAPRYTWKTQSRNLLVAYGNLANTHIH